MSDLTRIIPAPTPVTLGGTPLLASELRLGDLAHLEAYLSDLVPSPLDRAEGDLRALAEAGGGPAWKRLLADTIEAQEDWPPDLTDPRADALLSDPEGWCYFAWLVLRREQPALTRAAVAGLVAKATPDEARKLARVAWAIDPLAVLAAMVDGPPTPGRDPGGPRDWGKAWHTYLTTATGPAPAFEDLTLTQFSAFMAEGDLPDPGVDSGPVESADWAKIRRRAEFWAEIDRDAAPDTPTEAPP